MTSSKDSNCVDTQCQVDIIERPVQGPQAELDPMAAGEDIAVPYRDHPTLRPGHIYGEANLKMPQQQVESQVR